MLAAAEHAVVTKPPQAPAESALGDGITSLGVHKSFFASALGDDQTEAYNNKRMQKFSALTGLKKMRGESNVFVHEGVTGRPINKWKAQRAAQRALALRDEARLAQRVVERAASKGAAPTEAVGHRFGVSLVQSLQHGAQESEEAAIVHIDEAGRSGLLDFL